MSSAFQKFWFGFVFAAVMLAAPLAFAQTPERSPILQKFEAQGNKVDFIGSAHGLDGWLVVNQQGAVQYIYTTQDGAGLVGLLFAPDGTSVTGKQLQAYQQRRQGEQAAAPGADKSSSKSEKLYAATETASWVAIGDSSAPYIYVFINVNCDHCQNFLKDIDGAIKDGKIQARLVPYGEAEENRNGGAALLSVEQPAMAWYAYISGDKSALGADKVKDGAYQKIETNTALVREWKLGGPPFTLYRRPADGIVTAIIGRPENQMLLLAEFLK